MKHQEEANTRIDQRGAAGENLNDSSTELRYCVIIIQTNYISDNEGNNYETDTASRGR